mgnify:CR=1 FL=1
MALTRITQGVIEPNQNYNTHNINSTGIITATGANISGNMSVGGVLTYEDVTNIDSVGVITARNGLIVSGVTTTGAVSWGGHMLPTSNAAYDIGSADYKVRHLFLSDNSLKFVDSSDTEHPLSVDSGRLKFAGGMLLGNNIKMDTISGIVTASKFDGRLETLPNSNKTGAYVAVKEDSGTIITTTGNVTINQSIFSVGDIISVYNNSASNISIVQGTSVTLRLAGTATTGTRTLAQRGLMTVTCVASNEFVCSGGGLS